jgi:hypothetical protein
MLEMLCVTLLVFFVESEEGYKVKLKKRNYCIPLAMPYKVVIPRGVSATRTSPEDLKSLEKRFSSLGKEDLSVATITHITTCDDKQYPDHFVGYVEGEKRGFVLPRTLVAFQQGVSFSI